ncbi:CHAT domain-containing protein [Fusarium redolens]|uniref:CHAT domain-containing protein n=1 Tax=Fusarium redolens TaxID=48865 RepID=A0A9P9FY01_FUSRE|nr:CHAT domain-containing protein [Fusarium redolens]KAH7210810.1 CHAT domain-containing protein [Fusarium redolens]
MTTIEVTIQDMQNISSTIPDDPDDRARYLWRLALQQGQKYKTIGGISYLDESIRLLREATDIIEDDDPKKARMLSALSLQLGERYTRQKSISDLDEAILIARDAIDSSLDDDPIMPKLFSDLGSLLVDRYLGKGVKWDLDEAIDCSRQAVAIVSDDDLARAQSLNTLGIHLGHLHWRGGHRSNLALRALLEEAIAVSREAVRLTPKSHPSAAGYWKNLGTHLGHQYHSYGTNANLEEVIQCHLAAIRSEQSPSIDRIKAARDALPYCADVSDWQTAFGAVEEAVSLFPKLIFRLLNHSDKLYVLGQVSGLASDGAATALNAGKDLHIPLQLLEAGRGVLSQSMEEMRTDSSSLRVKHPDLAQELTNIRNALDSPISYDQESEDSEPSLKVRLQLRQEADKRLQELLCKIRKEPGFEYYLIPPSEADMRKAANNGPIVVINVSQFRCDAIIIESHQLRLLSLPKLRLVDVEGLYSIKHTETSVREIQGPISNNNFNVWDAVVNDNEWGKGSSQQPWGGLTKEPQDALGSPAVLKWLWDTVAEPILNALEFTNMPIDGKWPHIHWIPTGSLGRFPIHAAGNYYPGTTETVLDRVISSYSSSIKSIIEGRRRQTTRVGSQHALIVGMKTTQGYYSHLPFARKEVSLVRDLCKSMSLNPIEPDQRKENIVSHLPNCTVFHFAGHGKSNRDEPLNSQLLLNDWESDPFTVTSLLDTKLHNNPPFLAYLSACSTGRVDEERFSDESIHLISACQLAGFRHVIGTLWEVNDASCVDVARVTYETMRDGAMTDESVSRGLHAAALHLRNQWSKRLAMNSAGRAVAKRKQAENVSGSRKVALQDSERDGSRDITACDDDEDLSPLYWVPYVHFGV